MQNNDDEDIAIAAITALQHMGSQHALAALLDIYNTNQSATIKEKIVFALSQIKDPQAKQKLIEIAKDDPNSEIRENAIFWLGQNARDPEIIDFLENIVDQDPNQDVHEKAIFVRMTPVGLKESQPHDVEVL